MLSYEHLSQHIVFKSLLDKGKMLSYEYQSQCHVWLAQLVKVWSSHSGAVV